jgi:glycosyltransferase involved in cell wall biosynthesis
MSGVSERVQSVGRRAAQGESGLPDQLSVRRHATHDDGEHSAVLPLKVSILMCAFNEEECIEAAITGVLRTSYPCDIEFIVVDDGSTDDTALIAEKISDPRLLVHRLPNNMGKGYALRCAAALATGTHILPFDADLEYSPDDIPRMIEPVIARDYDVVYGARIFGLNTVYQSYRYATGNRILTRTANVLFDAHLSDLHTCLKLVSLSIFRQLALNESRFGLDTELTAILLRLGVRPFEVPVSYHSRSHAQGKKIGWRDGIACVAILVKVRLRPRKRLFAVDRIVIDPIERAGVQSDSYVKNR